MSTTLAHCFAYCTLTLDSTDASSPCTFTLMHTRHTHTRTLKYKQTCTHAHTHTTSHHAHLHAGLQHLAKHGAALLVTVLLRSLTGGQTCRVQWHIAVLQESAVAHSDPAREACHANSNRNSSIRSIRSIRSSSSNDYSTHVTQADSLNLLLPVVCKIQPNVFSPVLRHAWPNL